MDRVKDLLQRLSSFSRGLTGHPPPGKPVTAKEFQAWYLHTQATASSRTTDAYWLLVEGGYLRESKILARNLMERLFHSLFAGLAVENAAILSCVERRRHLRNLRKIHGDPPLSPEGQKLIAGENQKLVETQWLLKGSKPPEDLSLLEIARRVDWEKIYRACYAPFSAYAHGGCLPFSDWKDDANQAFVHWLATAAPVYTSYEYHRASCQPVDPAVTREWRSLLEEIRNLTLRENPPCPLEG